MSPESFPNDENGDVLRRMQDDGDDLSAPRKLEFEHVFLAKAAAIAFVSEVTAEEVTVTVDWYAERQCWNVQVSRQMVPSHAAITGMEQRLDAVARRLGGRADGWGCFKVRRQHDS